MDLWFYGVVIVAGKVDTCGYHGLATCSRGVIFLPAQEEDVMSIIKNAEEETERCLKNLKVLRYVPGIPRLSTIIQ